MTSWPNYFQVTPFDVHDKFYWGDVDGDGALDLLPPNSQSPNFLNLSKPLSPYLGWRIVVNQTDMTWSALPIGDETVGIAVFILLCLIPPLTAILACWIFRRAFYSIKINKVSRHPNTAITRLLTFYSHPVCNSTVSKRKKASGSIHFWT